MSRLPIEKMSAAFAGLRGSKSKVEMTVLFVFQALGYRGPFCKNRRDWLSFRFFKSDLKCESD